MPDQSALIETLKDHIASSCDAIGRLTGHVREPIGPYESWRMDAMSEDALRGYAAGQTDLLTLLVERLGDYDEETRSALSGAGLTFEMIRGEFESALIEALEQRHPGRQKFFGRLRKLNAIAAEIRTERLAINAPMPPRAEGEDFGTLYNAWRDRREERAWAWEHYQTGRHWQLSELLGRMTYRTKSREEADARDQCERELRSLARLCASIRHEKGERLRCACDALFQRRAA